MLHIRYLTVNKTDLAWLLHTSVSNIEKWKKVGLQQKSDGKFLLSDALAWLKERHNIELKNKLTAVSLSQQDLVVLLGVTRQTLTAWGRAGLPKNRNGTYNIKQVCSWLRSHYRQAAQREYHEWLNTVKKKLCRNVRQLEKFIAREK